MQYLSKLHVKKIKYLIQIITSSFSLVALLDATNEHGHVEHRSQSAYTKLNDHQS